MLMQEATVTRWRCHLLLDCWSSDYCTCVTSWFTLSMSLTSIVLNLTVSGTMMMVTRNYILEVLPWLPIDSLANWGGGWGYHIHTLHIHVGWHHIHYTSHYTLPSTWHSMTPLYFQQVALLHAVLSFGSAALHTPPMLHYNIKSHPMRTMRMKMTLRQ